MGLSPSQWGIHSLGHGLTKVTEYKMLHTEIEQYVGHRVSWSGPPGGLTRCMQSFDRKECVCHHILKDMLQNVANALEVQQ